NFLIHPFVGRLWGDPSFFLNEGEVQRIIEVPLSFFLEESPKELQFAYEGVTLQVQAYQFEGIVIWGATFRILSKFLSLILGLL
ncbi:MAG: coenzyme A pyrophosphatase, partial [Desulfatiglandales bacterium]